MKKLLIMIVGLVALFLVLFGTVPGAYGRGRILELMGLDSMAMETYEILSKRFPQSPWAERSQQRIALRHAFEGMKSPSQTQAERKEPDPGTRPSLVDQTLMPMEQAQQIQPASQQSDQQTLPRTQQPASQQDRRIEPSYGGSLGAYHRSKNKIHDIQDEHNRELMQHMRD